MVPVFLEPAGRGSQFGIALPCWSFVYLDIYCLCSLADAGFVSAMKMTLALTVALAALLAAPLTHAADKGDPKAQLQELVGKVRKKIQPGQQATEETFAPELKEFDALLAEHQGEKTDEVAQILLMKAMLYAQLLENQEKATALIKQLKTDFPETKPGKDADKILESFAKQAAAKKIQSALAVGSTFPDFDVKDLDGKPLSVSGYKGKVVVIDFWATWCGPCVGELPNVLKTYEKNHPKGLEIIGISLDQNKERLTKFIDDKKVPWRQYFDGLGWQNKLAEKYGVNSIPATYLLDKEGKILAKDLRGDALETAVAKALEAK
jgi:peroxiredoxin